MGLLRKVFTILAVAVLWYLVVRILSFINSIFMLPFTLATFCLEILAVAGTIYVAYRFLSERLKTKLTMTQEGEHKSEVGPGGPTLPWQFP